MIVSKGEFAKMVGRQPSAVSNWIAAGKLSGAALIGDGNRARINVPVAMDQLRALDIGQQLAQPKPILAAPSSPTGPAPPPNDDQARLLRARAEREELALVVDRAKAEELSGRWMVARDACDEWSRQLAGFIQAVESWLVTAAAADVAALDSQSPRDIAKCLRGGFRTLRQRLAEQAAREAADEPEETDDSDDDGDE